MVGVPATPTPIVEDPYKKLLGASLISNLVWRVLFCCLGMWCTFRIKKQDIWLSRKIKDQFNSTAHFSSFVLCYNLSMFCRCCCIEQPGSLFKTTGCCVIVLLLKFCCWGLILLYVLFFMLLTTARMYLYMLLLLFWSLWMLCLCCCYTDISVCFLVVVADHSLCRIVGISTALIYVCFIVVSNHSRGVIALLLLLLYWPLCMFCCCCCRPQPGWESCKPVFPPIPRHPQPAHQINFVSEWSNH